MSGWLNGVVRNQDAFSLQYPHPPDSARTTPPTNNPFPLQFYDRTNTYGVISHHPHPATLKIWFPRDHGI
ncbi:hypothetical protein Hypma_005686 [Hypsizygus marmoreus]|uniref:Uncharacterized protein n=1 Tax=Hypsizygus marmoreus TaxID=39966 RepID=A0A369K1N9_HYPMA|nr:hypothetical protein Hypma_005686 [Hypsizygus marmoreus]